MVKIDRGYNVIPFEIGELEFEANINDRLLIELEAKQSILAEQYAQIREEGEENTEEIIKKLNDSLGSMFDTLLGKGAYNKLYKQDPSAFVLFNILQQVMNEINNHVGEAKIAKSKAANQYLTKPKTKK